MMKHFQKLLEELVANPARSIAGIPLMSDSERHRLLVEWNDTGVDYPRDIPLHKFIEDQSERTPQATALIFQDEQLTYAQLNARANQLAHHLHRLGVGPDVLVA